MLILCISLFLLHFQMTGTNFKARAVRHPLRRETEAFFVAPQLISERRKGFLRKDKNATENMINFHYPSLKRVAAEVEAHHRRLPFIGGFLLLLRALHLRECGVPLPLSSA